MDWSRRNGRIAAAAALGIVAVLILARIADFGIWDPWELTSADLARQIATSEPVDLDRPPLATWLVAQGFSLFGIHEWSGRLPIGLAGLLGAFLAYLIAARFAGRRAGVVAAIVTGTSPLYLLNAREMLGAAPAFAASAGVFFCALSAVFRPAPLRAPAQRRAAMLLLWLGGLAICTALATMASGALLGVAPPLLAVAVAVAARRELEPPFAEPRRAAAAAVVLAAGVLAAAGCAYAVYADYAGFGYWTGGVARGGDPPTWEIAIERLFHSFAPWSGLLPLALAAMLTGARSPTGSALRHPEENALRLALVSWVAFGFLAQTVFTARFGSAPFVPVIGAAVAVALLLHDLSRAREGHLANALICSLFVLLILRDYHAYPSGPVEGLAVDGLEVPGADVFPAIRIWAVVLGLFALTTALTFAADPSSEHESLREDFAWMREKWRGDGRSKAMLAIGWLRLGIPVALIARQWKRGPGFRVWLVLVAGVLPVACVVFGAVALFFDAWLSQRLGSSLGARIGQGVLVVPVLVTVLVAVARLAIFAFAKMGSYRIVPLLVAGVIVAAYTSLGYQPALSSHFSPREVYDTFNRLAQSGEPLGEFRVGGRAAAYYAEGDIAELDSQTALVDFLRQEGRVWVAFRADDLAAINREYRRRTNRHLFVADARSARMLLATNQPVSGMENQNYLAEAVLDEPPRIEHPTDISFDDRIELIGYALELPHGDSVGPGEAFVITWYFRVRTPVPGSYQPFVHIDGPGVRLNGDHEPVDGRYPLRLWEAGDIVVDRQELRVPANYSRGNLTIFMGFFAGDDRLEVVRGPEDDANRARVGILPVR